MTATPEPVAPAGVPALAPEFPSRVVYGMNRDITTENIGNLRDATVLFALEKTIGDPQSGVTVEASHVRVPLKGDDNGVWYVSLPTAVDRIEPQGKWSITVTYGTRESPFAIIVPPGDTPINIYNIAQAFPVDPDQAGWLLTGIQIGTVTTGTVAAARIRGEAPTVTLDLTLPKGDKGDTGDTGPATKLTRGTVTTGPAGSQADITLGGTAPNQTLSMTIPQGAKGDTGDRGPVGPGLTILGTKANTAALPASGTLGDGWLIGNDLHVWNGSAWQNVGPVRGPQGDIGKTPQLTASAQTLAPGATATATIGGTAEAPALTIGVPRGRDGTTISKIAQPTPTTLRIERTADGGTVTADDFTLPVAKATFSEVRPGVWQPITT